MAEKGQIGIFPSEFDDPEEKKKEEWGLRYAKAIISTAEGHNDNFSLSLRRDTWRSNERIAQGFNDIEKLRKRALPTEREWVVLDHSIGTPVPKMIKILKESVYSHPYNPEVGIFDSHSHSRLERKKNELLAKMDLSRQVSQMKSQGLLPENMSIEGLQDAPKDAHEVEMYIKTNSKVIEQIAIEKLIKKTFYNSNMEQVERKIVNDLVNLAWTVIHTCVDEDGCFKIKHVHPLDFISSYVEHDDFSDAKYMGHIDYVSIGYLRQNMPHLSDEQLLSIARQNIDKEWNDISLSLGNKQYFNLTNNERQIIEAVRCRVFNFEVLQSDKVTYVEKPLNNGAYDISRRSNDYDIKSPDAKKKVHKGTIERIYHGKFVMNTEYMMEWAIKPNVFYKVRANKTIQKPCFSYVAQAPDMLEMTTKSVVESVTPNIEQMILLELKMRHLLAAAKPPGFSININAIQHAIQGMGMKGMKPKDAIDMMMATGDLYFTNRDEAGNPILSPGEKPIEFNPSTIDPNLFALAELWSAELAKVKEIMGMNDAVDASTPDKRSLIGVQQMAVAAHKSSIRSLQNAYLEVVREVAYRAAYAQQIAIKNDTVTDEVRDLLSDPEFKVLKAKDIAELMFNVKIELLPDDQQKQRLYERINLATQGGYLDVGDGMLIERLAEESLNKAEEVFMMKTERRKAEMQQARIEEAQASQDAEIAKLQAEIQKEQTIMQLKMQLEQMKGDQDITKVNAQEEEKRNTMVLEYDLKGELVEKAAEVNARYEGYDKGTQSAAPKAAGRVEPATKFGV